MPSSLLSASQLLALIDLLVPSRGSSGSVSAHRGAAGPATRLSYPADAAVALVHAIMVSLQFMLQDRPTVRSGKQQGTSSSSGGAAGEAGEAGEAGAAGAAADDDGTTSEADTAVNDDDDFQPGQGSTEHVDQARVQASILPYGWNGRAEDAYTLSYKHPQSSMEFLVKLGRMGGRVSVTGMAGVSGSATGVCAESSESYADGRIIECQDGEPHSFHTLLTDLVASETFFPWPRSDESASTARPIREAFASDVKVDAFVQSFVREIVVRFMPGLQVEGFTA